MNNEDINVKYDDLTTLKADLEQILGYKTQLGTTEKKAIFSFKNPVNNNKEEAKQFIKQIGFTIEQYNKRIYFGYKRFKQKLYNAYLLYNSQKNKEFGFKNESKTFEINLSKQAIFDRLMNEAKSKYGKIVYGIEKIYLVK